MNLEMNFGGIICVIGRCDVLRTLKALDNFKIHRHGYHLHRTILDLMLAGF